MHHQRFRKHGDPLIVKHKGTKRGEVQEYFYSSVLPYEGDECILWPYTKNHKGYGMMLCGDKYGLVTRFLCTKTNGPAPSEKHEAAHSCGKGHLGCVSKRHLSWKTRVENRADRIVHGTHNHGERNHTALITEAQAMEIFSLKGVETQANIAERLGIGKSIVSEIHAGRSWKWLTGASGSRHVLIPSKEAERAA